MNGTQAKSVFPGIQELGCSYRECYIVVKGSTEVRTQLKQLIGDPNAASKDSWLIRAGIALIAFPDPTISDLIGVTMVAAGLLRRRLKKFTLADMNRELREIAQGLDSLRNQTLTSGV